MIIVMFVQILTIHCSMAAHHEVLQKSPRSLSVRQLIGGLCRRDTLTGYHHRLSRCERMTAVLRVVVGRDLGTADQLVLLAPAPGAVNFTSKSLVAK